MTNDDTLEPKTTKWKLAATLVALGLVAAACGSDAADDAATATAEAAQSSDADGDAMEDEEAMEDDAMEDDAMEDGDAMSDDAMSEGRPVLELTFDGLEPLGDGFDYEVWTVVDGAPVSGGLFDIDADGNVVHTDDQDVFYGHEGATDVVISIEPTPDPDPAPAAAKPLGGVIQDDGSVVLTTDHPAAFGTDFTDVSGEFIIATPTTADTSDELSGVWFITVPGPEQGLDLPELPEGWVYEGWAVIDGVPVTTGTFTDPGAADDFDGFSGTDAGGPPYPGEDFIQNAPEGLEFPVDLTGAPIVISIEPADDNDPAPFALKPLVGEAPGTPMENTPFGAGPAAFSGTGTHG